MATAESIKLSLPSKHAPQQDSSDAKSFQEIYKTSYSHGLEAIYAIESIDLKSVRRLTEEPASPSIATAIPSKARIYTPPNQLQFDFGSAFREWIDSFILREPIHVLCLSKQAEKCLLVNGKSTLRDLIQADIRTFIFFKGMGQGLLDEIKSKLRTYINGRPLNHCQSIDISAWLRSLFGSIDRKKAAAALQSNGLNHLFSLSTAEYIEIDKLDHAKRTLWTKEAQDIIQRADKRQSLTEDLQIITNVFIRPWMIRRGGLATKSELIERFCRISDNSPLAKSFLEFLSDIYFDGIFPLQPFLIEADSNLFAPTPSIAVQYHRIIELAESYFYKSNLCYHFPHLTELVARELTRGWQGCADGFIEKALKASPRFQIVKNRGGEQLIRLML